MHEGTLQVNTSFGTGNVTVSSGATLDFNNADNRTYAGVISGEGNVVVTTPDAGELVLTGNSTYTGTTTIGGAGWVTIGN